MALFQSAFEEEYAHPHVRCQIASIWATWARLCIHPSTTLAYEKAMSLMQSFLAIGPTLEVQHRFLMGSSRPLPAVPFDCASYYIEMGELESAVEILERGRTLLWSQMRGLRTPIEQFVAVSEELENIATPTQARGIDAGARGAGTFDDHPSYSSPDVFSQMMENDHPFYCVFGTIFSLLP
jgi:hypothetical protein